MSASSPAYTTRHRAIARGRAAGGSYFLASRACSPRSTLHMNLYESCAASLSVTPARSPRIPVSTRSPRRPSSWSHVTCGRTRTGQDDLALQLGQRVRDKGAGIFVAFGILHGVSPTPRLRLKGARCGAKRFFLDAQPTPTGAVVHVDLGSLLAALGAQFDSMALSGSCSMPWTSAGAAPDDPPGQEIYRLHTGCVARAPRASSPPRPSATTHPVQQPFVFMQFMVYCSVPEHSGCSAFPAHPAA